MGTQSHTWSSPYTGWTQQDQLLTKVPSALLDLGFNAVPRMPARAATLGWPVLSHHLQETKLFEWLSLNKGKLCTREQAQTQGGGFSLRETTEKKEHISGSSAPT